MVVEVVGREIGVELEGVIADLTVEVAARNAAPMPVGNRVEAPDKHLVRLRVDRRDALREPTVVCLESGASRQLAAALIAAADLAEDLVSEQATYRGASASRATS